MSIAASTLVAAAQLPPSFQFVSIRKTAPAGPTTGFVAARPPVLTVLPGGRFEARRVSLEDLVRVAYGYEQRDPRHGVIESKVSWAARDLFDVTAAIDNDWSKPPAGSRIPAELRLLLRGLLKDRFALEAGLRTKRLSVYALRKSKDMVGAAPGLRPSTNECVGPYTDPELPEAAGKPPCAYMVALDRIEVGDVTMTQFSEVLAIRVRGLADRPIVDDTGLAGSYDIVLRTGLNPAISTVVANSDMSFIARAQGETLLGGTVVNDARWAPAVRRQLSKQLGLDLHLTTLPVPTLRIEGARRPSED